MKKLKKMMMLFTLVFCLAFTIELAAYAAERPISGGRSPKSAAVLESNIRYMDRLEETVPHSKWYQFTTNSQDAYYNITCKNLSIPTGLLAVSQPDFVLRTENLIDLKNSRIHLKENEQGNINLKLEKNTTYYVSVNPGINPSGNTGAYSIQISYRYDSVSDISSQASNAALGQKYTSSLDGNGDIDWYQFKAASDGTYHISFTNQNIETSALDSQKANMYLCTPYEEQLYQESAGKGESKTLTCSLNAGQTYLLKITMGTNKRNNTGDYSFRIWKDVPVSSVKIRQGKTITLVKGKTKQLQALVAPQSATDKSVAWSSKNKKTATVSKSGKITAKNLGTAKIACTSVQGNKKAFCTIKVVPSKEKITGISGKSGKSLRITWKKQTGITSYQLYRSVNKNKGFSRIATIKSNCSYTDKNIKPKKIYYYKVRACKMKGNTKLYGKFSEIRYGKLTKLTK
ncbi:Ig-like domain-containing protein [uncultured Robinsoniella sp.]|uniref:Ig-like domain-containing protein n=1 Tax=uncultured Robinsoniella sp. TaxID=904190 RepID=UPI00374E401C